MRITDVANRRIVVVRPEQTAYATATACHLDRQLASLTAALETLPLDRKSLVVGESASNAQEAAPGARPACPALANIELDRKATVRR